MSLTLLLDLDDTLLTNNVDIFLPAYLKALGKYLADYLPPEVMIRQLLLATQKMVENNDPSRTLEHTFDAAFYPALGVKREELQAEIDAFYAEAFPALRSLTQPRPQAVELVERAIKKGFRVVVATNPLFPRSAIHQRLSWAGLPPEDTPFDLITSYETFHFTKPNPAYFAEILAQLGWPDRPAVMVGNSPKDDIQPAAQAGLATFLLNDQPGTGSAEDVIPTAQGSLADLIQWLDELDPDDLPTNSTHVPSMMATLRSTPAALYTLTSRLTPEQWKRRPAPEEWSVTEILCHLRDVDREVNLPRLRKIIEEENPFIPGKDTDPWARERDYFNQDGPSALLEMANARSEIVGRLRDLRPEDWERTARHALFGPTTLKEMVSFIVNHDHPHLQQVVQTIHAGS